MFVFYFPIPPNLGRSISPGQHRLVRHHRRLRPEQMKDDAHRPAYTFGGLKLPWGVVGLTGAVWTFFYMEGMPLDPGSTGVVGLAVIILVMVGGWLLVRVLARGPHKGAAK
jgi:hypothetical protein